MANKKINKNSLEFPREARRSLKPSYDPEVFGRWSERFARFLGTARFLVFMTAFVIFWVVWNSLAPENMKFDHYPFIFLTLLLSLQASYAAPLILLAQNRQTDRDRIQGNKDRERDERNMADTEYLTRELASLRSALSEVTTKDYLHKEMTDAIEEFDLKLRQRHPSFFDLLIQSGCQHHRLHEHLYQNQFLLTKEHQLQLIYLVV